jgi:hypothetical protein
MSNLWKPLLLSTALLLGTHSVVAQDPLVAFPNNYKMVLDNSIISVIRVHYGPHEHIGTHDHSSYPTIYVYLNDSGPVHFKHDEKPPFEITRPPSTTGAFRVSPGRMERHDVDNLSDKSADFLRIELKQIPVGSKTVEAFRGKAPAGPLKSSHAVEFTGPKFDIERVICETGTPCSLDSSSSPSLLVALSEFTTTDAASSKSMKLGDTQWIPASHPVAISTTASSPVHLIRITLK